METNTIPLSGMVIVLRDSNGRYYKTTQTDATGHYAFGGLASGHYGLEAACDRTQVAVPNQSWSTPNDPAVNFKMRNVPARLTVNGEPDDFVVVTALPITGNAPPDVAPGGIASFSATVGLDHKIGLKVTYGNWYMTCWRYHTGVGYVKAPSVNLGLVKPLDTLTEDCQ